MSGVQAVRDAIRSAYDQGYNDARLPLNLPRDAASGYRGREKSEEISESLEFRLNRLGGLWDGWDVDAARIGRAAFAHVVDLDMISDTSNDADAVIEQIKKLGETGDQELIKENRVLRDALIWYAEGGYKVARDVLEKYPDKNFE